jgi:hypothetical protein
MGAWRNRVTCKGEGNEGGPPSPLRYREATCPVRTVSQAVLVATRLEQTVAQ